jgi:hypothetical protein
MDGDVGFRNAPPHAGHMLESLRGLGYTPSTAIADLIDNSVAANARNIDITIEWNEANSWIRIVDDGHGMDDQTLENGMRIGARDPRAKRAPADLGRFGLGLKTASLSQARCLTVASRCEGGGTVCLRWDLDLVGLDDGATWPLFEGPSAGSHHLVEPVEQMPHGTLVLWERLDRIVTEAFASGNMIELADDLDQHLGMTFHRLLEGLEPLLRIRLNGRAIKPWDPYVMGHPGKALESPEFRNLGYPGVTVQCHVLPHRDLLSVADAERASGPHGWTQQQGFYVYRNRRLIVPGGWLGLGELGRPWPLDEAHRLARIRLDIPNDVDHDWKINVLKSAAVPPVRIKSKLLRLARQTRESARRVFAHRGQITPTNPERAPSLDGLWQARRSARGTNYTISRDHEFIGALLQKAGPMKSDLLALFRLLEATVPVQRIWLDTAENKETPQTGFVEVDEEDVRATLTAAFDALVSVRGLSSTEARARLSRTAIFASYAHLIDALEPVKPQ